MERNWNKYCYGYSWTTIAFQSGLKSEEIYRLVKSNILYFSNTYTKSGKFIIETMYETNPKIK